MEQKDAYEQGLSRSNRTFMELKYHDVETGHPVYEF